MPAGPDPARPVLVIGAGISGVACAQTLRAAGVAVQVLDQGRRIGGRMALRTVAGRVIDIGAPYLTATDPAFVALIDDWSARGLARPWTDAPANLGRAGLTPGPVGPIRWAAPGGLRCLVEDLATGLDIRSSVTVSQVESGPSADGPSVDGVPASAVVLAMPDPQARRLVRPGSPAHIRLTQTWEPSMALAAGWPRRTWPSLTAAFVDDDDLSFLADDGDRRGDDVPVLVAHSTSALANRHLQEPAGAAVPMLAALTRLLGRLTGGRPLTEPDWVTVHRWTFARPGSGRDQPYHLGEDLVGLCGDGWSGQSGIEAGFLSGVALGRRLADRLSATGGAQQAERNRRSGDRSPQSMRNCPQGRLS